jgi:hypothetical protein
VEINPDGAAAFRRSAAALQRQGLAGQVRVHRLPAALADAAFGDAGAGAGVGGSSMDGDGVCAGGGGGTAGRAAAGPRGTCEWAGAPAFAVSCLP